AYTTLELKINLVRALGSDTGPVRAEGRVVHPGRQVATAEGKLYAADGRLYAHGSTTCLVFTL
ncbi:MAG: PaaI family thioesterase, partial [Burkholderiales bacterium]